MIHATIPHPLIGGGHSGTSILNEINNYCVLPQKCLSKEAASLERTGSPRRYAFHQRRFKGLMSHTNESFRTLAYLWDFVIFLWLVRCFSEPCPRALFHSIYRVVDNSVYHRLYAACVSCFSSHNSRERKSFGPLNVLRLAHVQPAKVTI